MRALAFALVLLVGRAAPARVVLHTARGGETAASLAADYYGNRSLAIFIAEQNNLQKDQKVKPGQRVRIPTAFVYKVRKGDTVEALSARFLDDKRRVPFFVQLSGLKQADKLREGQDLVVPFNHVHRATAPESLASVAKQFYGDAGKARLIQDYNFRGSPMLTKGDKVVLPVSHVRIRAVRLAQSSPPPVGRPAKVVVAPALKAAPDSEAQKREEELARKVGAQIAEAERQYHDGNYSEVPSALDKVLSAEDPSEAQLAEIFRLKAYAYVALGMEELAINAFREVIARKPDLRLDEAMVSPKIRDALEAARKP